MGARAMPKDAATLIRWGCTALVSLTAHMANRLDLITQEAGVKWLHAPLEPISNARQRVFEQDYQSFELVPIIIQWLQDGHRVVVHCQAGCHRTGIFCYVILRQI